VVWVEQKEVFLGTLKVLLSNFETRGIDGVKADTGDTHAVDDGGNVGNVGNVDDVEIWRVLLKVLDGLVWEWGRFSCKWKRLLWSKELTF